MKLFRRARDSFVLQVARDALPGVAVALILVLVYAVVQLNDDNVELKAKDAKQEAMACPTHLGSMIFSHSGFTKMELGRPGLARLSCYYSKGVKG